MSRTGNCWDNAPSESFFATLKTELDICHASRSYVTRDAARVSIFDDIECYDNRIRLHSVIGDCSPVEYEQLFEAVTKATSDSPVFNNPCLL